MLDPVAAVASNPVKATMAKRLAVFPMALSQVVLIGIVLARYPAHLSDPLWPAYAKAHLVSQIAALTGLACVSLLLLFTHFRSGSKWAWYGHLLSGLVAYGGYWIAVGVAEPVVPWRSAYSTFSALSAAYFLGLALGSRHCFSPGP
jgi:hypothetical protein